MGKKKDLAKMRESMKALDRNIRQVPVEVGSERMIYEYKARTPRSGFGDHEAVALAHYLQTDLGYEVFRFDDSDQEEGIVSHIEKKIGVKMDYPSALFRSLLHEASHVLTQGRWETTSYQSLADSIGIELPEEYKDFELSFEDELVAETVAVVVGELFGQKYADSSAWFMASTVHCLDNQGRLIRALNKFGGIEVVENTALQLAAGIRSGLVWLHSEGPLATANTK